MTNKINLVEILKDAPEGTTLYSPICGEVTLKKTGTPQDSDFPIEVYDSRHFCHTFTKEGLYFLNSTECLLFPSKECRDWKYFFPKWKFKQFTPFQKVLVKSAGVWTPRLYGYLELNTYAPHHVLADNKCCFDADIIPYKSNESLTGKITE